MKNILGLLLIALATLISFTRSCKNTTKAIKSMENVSSPYIKYADNTDVNTATPKDAIKAVSNVKTSTDLHKVIADPKKDSINNLKPKEP